MKKSWLCFAYQRQNVSLAITIVPLKRLERCFAKVSGGQREKLPARRRPIPALKKYRQLAFLIMSGQIKYRNRFTRNSWNWTKAARFLRQHLAISGRPIHWIKFGGTLKGYFVTGKYRIRRIEPGNGQSCTNALVYISYLFHFGTIDISCSRFMKQGKARFAPVFRLGQASDWKGVWSFPVMSLTPSLFLSFPIFRSNNSQSVYICLFDPFDVVLRDIF